MKNSIAISVISSLLSLAAFGQVTFKERDTLRFTADSSYSRAIMRYHGFLIFGTSKTGVVGYSEQTNLSYTWIEPSPHGEFRDLAELRRHYLGGMVSGDNGEIVYVYKRHPYKFAFDPGIFYDDIATYKKRDLITLGDPVDGYFFLRVQSFHRRKETEVVLPSIPNRPGEACYAASGTTAQVVGNDYLFVSGGPNAARFHRFSLKDSSTYRCVDLPMVKGEGAGPFSVHFTDSKRGVIVGGNYTQPKETAGTCVYTSDGGKTWTPSATMPNGYRSCVTGTKKLLFCCGTTGIDYSQDGGKTWKAFDTGNFCALLLEKKTLYATTNKGYCIRYQL